MLVHVSLKKIETFNVSLESTQNKQQYVTKITGTEKEKVMVIRNVIQLLSVCSVILTYSLLN